MVLVFLDRGDNTGEFDWDTGTTESGVYSVTFEATDDVLTDTQSISIMVYDESMLTPYNQLLNNRRIVNAIESSHVIEPGKYRDILIMKIVELEMNRVVSWNNYQHPTPWLDEEVLIASLQKVALSLYTEVNNLVPWSILDYSDEDLSLLLGDLYLDEINKDNNIDRMFNHNPLDPRDYVDELRELYPDIDTQKDLLYSTVIRMREDGWNHISGNDDRRMECGLPRWGHVDFQCMDQGKFGGSRITPLFIYSILQSQNIPSKKIDIAAHGSILYPTIRLAMDGGCCICKNFGRNCTPSEYDTYRKYIF